MPLPTLVKTREARANKQFANTGSVANDGLALVLGLKKALISGNGGSANTVPWTVKYSCGKNNGGANTAGSVNDAVDRWQVSTDITAGAAWVILANAGIPGFQLCIFYNGTGTVIVAFSPQAGFTGGSTGARPTATDEFATGTTNLVNTGGAGQNYVLQTVAASDGSYWHVICYSLSAVMWYLHASVPKNPISNTVWANPAIYCFTTAAPTTTNLCASVGYFNARIGSTPANVLLSLTGEGWKFGGTPQDLNTTMTFADEDTNEWLMAPCGLYCVTIGHRGPKGAMMDVWLGNTSFAVGDSYPGSGTTYQFIHWGGTGGLIVPWDTAVGAMIIVF